MVSATMTRTSSRVFVLTLLHLLASCAHDTDTGPEEMPPDTETACDDGLDDDADGLTDCADPDCGREQACLEADCDDGFDNDHDRLVDCADPDCWRDDACFEADCDDGLDNDDDGLVDCEDGDCDDDTACGEDCENLLDDDDDGLVDCQDDDCWAVSACTTESVRVRGGNYRAVQDHTAVHWHGGSKDDRWDILAFSLRAYDVTGTLRARVSSEPVVQSCAWRVDTMVIRQSRVDRLYDDYTGWDIVGPDRYGFSVDPACPVGSSVLPQALQARFLGAVSFGWWYGMSDVWFPCGIWYAGIPAGRTSTRRTAYHDLGGTDSHSTRVYQHTTGSVVSFRTGTAYTSYATPCWAW